MKCFMNFYTITSSGIIYRKYNKQFKKKKLFLKKRKIWIIFGNKL